ncbi:sodium:phosphate symporter [Halovenus marina]|uniref:sodium:phosphate symporter n=1 Tax=Halovenus marina TaxID=3396621 RepID=UPI003F57C2BF
MDSNRESTLARVRNSTPVVVGALGSILLFLFAVQLLSASTEAGAVPLERFFRRHVDGSGQALGASWLATYALTNGSVVAALAVSLFESGILTATQLFVMLAGSRLGGAAIVLLIGALDYVQKRRYSFSDATRLGVLTFLVSHSVYLPATALGSLLLPTLQTGFGGASERVEVAAHPLLVFAPATSAIVDTVGIGIALVVALLALFASLTLFDRMLKRISTDWLRTRLFRRFRHKWVAFALGVLITGVTTSVAFSVGVVVPLYNRGYLKRREVVPYVLGANIGTLFDTAVIAVLLESPSGLSVVLSLIAVATVITTGTLVWFSTYFRVIETVQTRLLADRWSLIAFLASLVVFPLLLVLLP